MLNPHNIYYAHTFMLPHLQYGKEISNFNYYTAKYQITSFNEQRFTFVVDGVTKTVELWRIACVYYKAEGDKLALIGFDGKQSFVDQQHLLRWREQEPFVFQGSPLNIVIHKGDFATFKVTEYTSASQLWKCVCLCWD